MITLPPWIEANKRRQHIANIIKQSTPAKKRGILSWLRWGNGSRLA